MKQMIAREGFVRIFTDEKDCLHIIDLSGAQGAAAGASFELAHIEVIEQFLSEIGVADSTIPKKGKSRTVEATNITDEAFRRYKQ